MTCSKLADKAQGVRRGSSSRALRVQADLAHRVGSTFDVGDLRSSFGGLFRQGGSGDMRVAARTWCPKLAHDLGRAAAAEL